MYRLITQIQGFKTSIIDFAAIIYGIGLISWSINAHNNSLGLVSAFNTQYFTAGIVPCLIFIVVFYLVFYNGAAVLKNSFKKRITRDRKRRRDNPAKYYKRRKFFLKLSIGVAVCYMVVMIAYSIFADLFWLGGLVVIFCLLLLIFNIILLKLTVKSERKEFMSFKRARRLANWLNQGKISLVSLKLIIVVYALACTYAYGNYLYPLIPQELGGAKPKACVLECKKGIFTPNTTSYLFKDTSSQIMESRDLYVYYYNSDIMIIKRKYDNEGFEISRRDVVLIRWLSDGDNFPFKILNEISDTIERIKNYKNE